MMGLAGWLNLFNKEAIVLAIPGIIAGALLVLIVRNVESDAALPLAMVLIPGSFYLLLFVTGSNLEEAREKGWVGEASPPVPGASIVGNFIQFECPLRQRPHTCHYSDGSLFSY